MTRDIQEILSTLIILELFLLYVDACAYAMYTLHSEACLCLNQRGHLAKRFKSDVENMLRCLWRYPTPKPVKFFLPIWTFVKFFFLMYFILGWSLQRCSYRRFCLRNVNFQLGWIMKYRADNSMFRTECESELRFGKTIIKMVLHVGWMVVYCYSFLEDEVSNIDAIAPRTKLSKQAFLDIIIRFSNDWSMYMLQLIYYFS